MDSEEWRFYGSKPDSVSSRDCEDAGNAHECAFPPLFPAISTMSAGLMSAEAAHGCEWGRGGWRKSTIQPEAKLRNAYRNLAALISEASGASAWKQESASTHNSKRT
jgi:hypothetical protein